MSAQIVWFRNDLRLHDHEPLARACSSASSNSDVVIPVYIFDPRLFGIGRFCFDRVAHHRRRFLCESLRDLDGNLRRSGSRLWIYRGNSHEVLARLARSLEAGGVFFYQELAPDEKAIERQVQRELQSTKVRVATCEPEMLYQMSQLPFSICETPDVFSNFRRRVESESTVPVSLPQPRDLCPPSADLPALADSVELGQVVELKVAPVQSDTRAVLGFEGGETAGLRRLEEYFWKRDQLRFYKSTRNQMLGPDYSSKFSAWLACGCISARRIHDEVCRYERDRVKNDSTYWLIFELLWRDYFRLMVAKHGSRVFQVGGPVRVESISVGGVDVSLHPAGHILGSAQVRMDAARHAAFAACVNLQR